MLSVDECLRSEFDMLTMFSWQCLIAQLPKFLIPGRLFTEWKIGESGPQKLAIPARIAASRTGLTKFCIYFVMSVKFLETAGRKVDVH